MKKAVLLVLLTASACVRAERVEEASSSSANAVVVDAAPVEKLEVARSLSALGSLEAPERVVVSPETRGVVESVHFQEGAVIPRHERPVLFRIDDDLLELEVQAAEAQLAVVEADLARREAAFRRQEILYRERATTEAAYTDTQLAVRQARAARKQAEVSLELARERLDQATIRAPLSGVLGERWVSPGDFVREGQRLVEIISLDPMEVSFSVPERHRNDLETGQTIHLTTEAFGDRRFVGQVVFVAPDIDPQTRTVRLKARIPNPDLILKPGLFARVELVLGEAVESLLVPEEAVVPRGGKFFLYEVDGGVARRHEVTLGSRLPGKVVVLDGIGPQAQVIVGGLQRVSDGYAVEVRRAGGE